MLRNVSYKNDNIKNEIDDLIGNSYSFFEKIKKGGVGSGKLLITKANKEIENLIIFHLELLNQSFQYHHLSCRHM